MKLMTKAQEKTMLANAAKADDDGYDPKPVIKLFNPVGRATFLLTEYYPETDAFYGLCDMGQGFPELGYVSKTELETYRGAFGLGIEREYHFRADKTLREYADDARVKGRIDA